MRKIISLILSLVMLVSLLCVPAFAEGYGYNNEITAFLSQLGITDSVVGTEDGNITRAEFTAMVVRGLNMTSLTPDTTVFEDSTNSPFIDEIHIAKALGITNGTSATTFSPDLTVSTSVAAKMAVTALGYADKAEATGGYPSAYLKLASSLDLFSGVSASNDALSLSDACTLIYNMMLADAAVVSGVEDGNLTVNTANGINLLTENFGYTYTSGIVDTVSGHGINFAAADANVIEIGGRFFKTDFDFTHLLGYNVDAWYDDDGYVKVAIPADGNKSVKIDAENIVAYSSFVLSAEDDSTQKQKSYNLEKGFSFILNGRIISHTDSSFMFPDGTIELIDNNGNGKYDFVIADKTEYFVITGINAVNGVIYDSNSAHKSISLESDSDYSVSLTLNAAPATVYDLAENMVCEVRMSEDGKLCKVNAVSTAVSGIVSESGNDYYVIDGKSYEYTAYFAGLGITVNVGNSYDFLLSSDGRIVGVANASSSMMKYGYYIDYSKKSGLDSKVSLKIMTTMGDITTFDVKDRVVLDGTTVDASSDTLRSLFKNGDIPKYQVVRYKETDGVITHLDTADSADAAWTVGEWESDDNSLTKYVDKQTVRYRSSVTFGIPNVSFKNAVIFEVPLKLKTDDSVRYSDDLFMVTGTGTIANDATPTVDAYDYDERYLPAVIVLYRSTGPEELKTTSTSSVGYMVREITDAIDSEGTALKLLKVYGGGKYQQYFINPVSYQQMTIQGKIPECGDIVRLTTDAKGYVNGISIDMDYIVNSDGTTTHKVNYGQGGVSTTSYEYLTYYSGRVISHGNGHIALDADQVPSSSVLSGGNIVNLSLGNVKYVVFEPKTGEVYAGNSASVVSKIVGGIENASYVVCKTSHYSVNTIYIYLEE